MPTASLSDHPQLEMDSVAHSLCITPNGFLRLLPALGESGSIQEAAECSNDFVRGFEASSASGLTLLASHQVLDGGLHTPYVRSPSQAKSHDVGLPPSFGFWRQFARRYFTAICRQYSQASDQWNSPMVPDDATLDQWLQSAPPMRGIEYLSIATLRSLWTELDNYTKQQVVTSKRSVADYLKSLDPAWNLVGRVTFHLAENKRNPDAPFAFLATYTERQSAKGTPQHIPLSEAVRESIESRNTQRLDELLEPVVRASRTSPFVAQLLESRALFSPQAWGIRDAWQFLSSVPAMESAGVIVRVPNWWNASRPPRPQVQVRIGSTRRPLFSLDDTLDFDVDVAIDGEPLTAQELQQLMKAREGMALLRGKWIQVDHQRLQDALSHWKELQKQHVGGLDFLQGMRLLSGAAISQGVDDEEQSWARIVPGAWLEEVLQTLRDPGGNVQLDPGEGLNATLRHYQVDGVRWLWFATQLGLGVCLADDMGLGKTIQMIALLKQLKTKQASSKQKHQTSLLIVPTSLLGNWQREVEKFAPDLKLFVAHRSVTDADTLKKVSADPVKELKGYDLVATTYGLARNAAWLADRSWQLIILDEAQAIKNASSTQTKSIKKLSARSRVVLTGTPVENHLGDLWSLFDFCSPGLLGSASEFKKFVNEKDEKARSRRLASIRKLIRPYVLRRLKTDPDVVPDLPAKTEMRIDCGLSPKQATLYQQVLEDTQKLIEITTGIQRRGLVLSVLMQLKQICNHPSLYLKQSSFASKDAGKFAELESICATLIEKQEKLLVFTQFQSMCEPLHEFLAGLFGLPGLVLTGKTSAGKRGKLVAEFQQELGPPFFVISLKAGGTGLNLTEACHIVHFDRWWNPAVEDQATDRAFRIGQKRNVLVHKFVCRGTLEDRIDELIQSKKKLSHELFGKDGELNLTEMSNDELMKFISLDLNKATA